MPDLLKKVDMSLLHTIADMDSMPTGAFNIRKNGQGIARQSSENITIEPKKGNPGIDIYIKPFTKGEEVHIPVIITETGINDKVYNDFYVGEGADVLIVAGCGIHNCGGEKTEHDGIHRFFIGKNAKVKYVEKHYGEGEGTGERILNPVTEVTMEEGSYCEMEMIQLAGVDSTLRETEAALDANAKIVITERLLTHGSQKARSNMTVNLNGKNSSAQIVSRSVARDHSEQVFYPRAVGNTECRAHVQCDSIIMDKAKIRRIIRDFLTAKGFETVEAEDGAQALRVFSENSDIALAVLDIMMPEMNGWEVCRKIRETSDVPVIFLTARGEEFDELECFECGADDFITKPFSPTVLVKRIEARLKRTADNPTDKIVIDGLVIDVVAHSVVCDGHEIELTHKEYGILHKLASNRERVFSREQLLDDIWGFDFLGDSRTVDSHVARLRTKLGDWGSRHLRTVYGAGYKIEVN